MVPRQPPPPPRMGFLRAMKIADASRAPPRPSRARLTAPGGQRGAMLAALAAYGDEGAHAETLAVALWRGDPEAWGMARHPEHANLHTVVARLSALRSRGLVEPCDNGHRLTRAGRGAASRFTAKRAA